MPSELPAFEESGNLPPGIYQVGWHEIEARFAVNPRRQLLLERLRQRHPVEMKL